jgi:hypothetical protein
LIEWRFLAAGWLEADEIVMNETGFVGRIVLRLLDALHEASALAVEHDKLFADAQLALSECGGAVKAAKLLFDVQQDEAPWLLKDFDALYRAAQRMLQSIDACAVRGHEVAELRAQLERLKPAFAECEVARRMGRQTREGT